MTRKRTASPRILSLVIFAVLISPFCCWSTELPPDIDDYAIMNSYEESQLDSPAEEAVDDLYQDENDQEDSDVFDQEDDDCQEDETEESAEPCVLPPVAPLHERRINEIIISGNKFTSRDSILSYVTYKVGEVFNPIKTGQLIRSIYYGIKRFRNITVKGENISPTLMNLHLIVDEKIPLKGVVFEGNSHLSEKDINKKIDFSTIYAIDPEELAQLTRQLKKLYVEKGFNYVDIETDLSIDDDGRAVACFKINEGRKSIVKQVHFVGNCHISRKELRDVLLTKEDWLLGFMDRSGMYHPEMVEYGDKQAVEHFYQNRGFLHARVTNIVTDVDCKTKNISLTYEIEEGEQYTISCVEAPGNDLLPERVLLSRIPLRPGMLYSRELVASSIKRIERLWGNHGYIFAHVEPSIIPDDDAKTVKISFKSEVGNKVTLNRLTIRGNKKTRDKIIRRKIALQEGEPLTQDGMDVSKRNVESLGYFDPKDGVNWKVKRLDEETANLDLHVKETKTGNFGLKFNFGGSGTDIQSPSADFSVALELADTNLFGSGIHLNTNASWSKAEQSFLFHLAQPWLFDKPILGALDIYHKRPVFDELRNVRAGRSNAVHEKLTGASLTGGVICRSDWELFHDMNVLGNIGIDSIRYQGPVLATIYGAPKSVEVDYQKILDKSFTPGEFVWLTAGFEQDTRNHPIHTSHGHRWRLNARAAVPSFLNNIAYYKVSLDAGWFTPLINEYDLVLKLHGYFGVAAPLKNHVIPFGELYHIGGPTSVRGYLFGQIGPKYAGDSIGGTKAFFVNAELIFPIAPDMSIKGICFYDGGAGWNNPYTDEITGPNLLYLRDNDFTYRHSIGVGLRLLKPMPIRIDWGFKIDPRRNRQDPGKSETPYEVHFGMSYDW